MNTNDLNNKVDYLLGQLHIPQTDVPIIQELKDFIESLLEQARREVIEDMPDNVSNSDFGEFLAWSKQQLRDKYLTPTGNLNK